MQKSWVLEYRRINTEARVARWWGRRSFLSVPCGIRVDWLGTTSGARACTTWGLVAAVIPRCTYDHLFMVKTEHCSDSALLLTSMMRILLSSEPTIRQDPVALSTQQIEIRDLIVM